MLLFGWFGILIDLVRGVVKLCYRNQTPIHGTNVFSYGNRSVEVVLQSVTYYGVLAASYPGS